MADDSLLFGEKSKKGLREWIYARYACGDPVSVIAAEEGISTNEVYLLMKSCPDDYEKTKVQREQFNGVRIVRSLSLVDAHNLRVLEGLLDKTISEIVLSEAFREIAKIGKDLAHRVNLFEGKATEIVEQQTREKPMPLDEMERRIAEAKNAGDGIDNGSVEGNGTQ